MHATPLVEAHVFLHEDGIGARGEGGAGEDATGGSRLERSVASAPAGTRPTTGRSGALFKSARRTA